MTDSLSTNHSQALLSLVQMMYLRGVPAERMSLLRSRGFVPTKRFLDCWYAVYDIRVPAQVERLVRDEAMAIEIGIKPEMRRVRSRKPRRPKPIATQLSASATEWLRQNDPKTKADRRRKKRDDAKAKKQAEQNPALVAHYARHFHARAR